MRQVPGHSLQGSLKDDRDCMLPSRIREREAPCEAGRKGDECIGRCALAGMGQASHRHISPSWHTSTVGILSEPARCYKLPAAAVSANGGKFVGPNSKHDELELLHACKQLTHPRICSLCFRNRIAVFLLVLNCLCSRWQAGPGQAKQAVLPHMHGNPVDDRSTL